MDIIRRTYSTFVLPCFYLLYYVRLSQDFINIVFDCKTVTRQLTALKINPQTADSVR